MRRYLLKSAIIAVLVASLGFTQPASTLAMEDHGASDYEELTEGDSIDETLLENGISDGEENLSENILEPTGEGDVSKIHNPRTTSDGVSTWDCIWFGNYWQEDTNGDGHCYSDGSVRTYYYNGSAKDYLADDKQPIKWRVLQYDTETGDALLLSDKLLEVIEYDGETRDLNKAICHDTTWEMCTLRSFLNNYGKNCNDCGWNYEKDGFMKNAFSKKEINAIEIVTLENEDNILYSYNLNFRSKNGSNPVPA